MIVAILMLALIAGVLFAVMAVRRKIRRFSVQAFGTESLTQGLEKQKEQLSVTPKSVSGMTKIYLPMIQRDFPDFHLNDFIARSENMLKSAFLAVSEENIGLLKEAGDVLENAVRLQIEENRQQQVEETYRDVAIHKTEIAGYEKKDGTCVVTLQMAVGYLHFRMQEGKVISGDRTYKKQTRYNVELLYVQDPDKVTGDASALVGARCPNCGAPVKTLGAKYCEYCGSGVREINIHSWSIHRYYEVDYHKIST